MILIIIQSAIVTTQPFHHLLTNILILFHSRFGGGRRGISDRRVYVSNIPYEYKWQDLKDLFRQQGSHKKFT